MQQRTTIVRRHNDNEHSKYGMLYPLSTGAPVHFYSVYRQQSKIADQDRFSLRKKRQQILTRKKIDFKFDTSYHSSKPQYL